MDHLIASFLILKKKCPLPGLGNLYVSMEPSQADFSIHKICSPKPIINYSGDEMNAEDLVNYIAYKKDCLAPQALEDLNDYCESLKSVISKQQEHKLDGIGKFSVDIAGKIHFQEYELAGYLLQPIDAIRVIHPDAEHAMLVGDKETTNTKMTEYFNEEPVKKDWWWKWAIILGVIGVLLLLFYFIDPVHNSSFGNAMKILP